MSDELTAIAERIRQRRTAAAASAAAAPAPAPGAYTIGDAVFDSISGLDGTVLGAGLPDRLRAGDVKLHLDDGRDVIRGTGELIARPRNV